MAALVGQYTGNNGYGTNARPEDTNTNAAERLRDRSRGIKSWASTIGAVTLVVTSLLIERGDDAVGSLKSKLVPIPATTMTVSSAGN